MAMRVAAALAAALVLLAGCGDPDASPHASATATPDPMAAGTCFNPASDAPEPRHAVSCDQPHRFEMLARQDIPLEYFADGAATTADRATLHAALTGKTDSATQLKFATYARAYCVVALQHLTGLNDADFSDASPESVQAVVHTSASAPAAFLNAGDEWLRQPLLICANRFAHPVRGTLTTQLLTADTPAVARSCYDLDASGRQRAVACTRPHDGESALDFDATPLLDADQLAIASQDARAPFPASVQETLDAACEATLDTVIGRGYDDEHVTARAVRGAQGWGRGGYVNTVVCQFVATGGDQRLPAGSLFGIGDREVALVER